MNPQFSRSLLWLAILAVMNPALAGPDGCTVSGGTRTCEGDQSDGISFTSGPDGLEVQNLTQDIAPATGTRGVRLSRNGGPGDDGWGTPLGFGTNGDTGGSGGEPALTIDIDDWSIMTTNAHGVLVQANGGVGGGGGWATGVPIPPIFVLTGPAFGGNGGRGGAGGNVQVTMDGAIVTAGDNSIGIFAESKGGRGGNGGWAFSTTYAEGGNGGAGGDGGSVTINNLASITTVGIAAYGILGRSFGGEGGDGGEGDGVYGQGGAGLGSGNGGNVSITNAGLVQTAGIDAIGVVAQSIGGFAGGGGGGGGLFAYGGSGNSAGDGGTVSIINSGEIYTAGSFAYALQAQSIGGGGGNGGSSSGIFSYGGSGDAGGDGGAVIVSNAASLGTTGNDSSGVFAQSVGGGGGNGGDSRSGGVFFSLSMGGKGGPGGDGDTVNVDSTADATITTTGLRATGIHAQSLGGGGGNGGYAVALSGGSGASVSVAIGGDGNQGGDAKEVTVNSYSNINISGADADGIRAESLGGGGGNGGGSVAVSGSDGFAASFTFGGQGGGGGDGSDVVVNSGGIINTAGDRSIGINALSLGGGGGSGGWTITGSGAGMGAVSVGIGGDGGDGGISGLVTVNSLTEIHTLGAKGYGISARSIGGGGGDGGWTLTGAGAGGAAGTFSVGGTAGGGGDGNDVVLNSGGTISTAGFKASGLLAESIGGGGGDGGWGISGAGAGGGALTVTIGGSAGDGGSGGTVLVNSDSDITTTGAKAYGIRARSVGGGGGDGGFTLSGAGAGTAAGTFNLGGSGGGGGHGSAVTVNSSGSINTGGEKAVGVLAASIGGGGGDGGWSITGSGAGTAAVSVGIGGSGGGGGDGADVVVGSSSDIATAGDRSHGIRARSIGGGGGDGGFTISGAGAGSGAMTFNVGGSGGLGGDSGTVEVGSSGAISTDGVRAVGILAESIGGGGGDGGFSITGAGAGWGAVSVSVGGSGTAGGFGNNVEVNSASNILTLGERSYGIRARSIGGGGGDGGFSISGAGAGTFGGTFNLGGSGAAGGDAGSVVVRSSGIIETLGYKASGILAESLGGGGGDGGFSITGSGAGTAAVSFGIGGSGDGGGSAEMVSVLSESAITTAGDKAHAIRARSLGGGGGDGGFSISGAGAGKFGGTFNLGGSGGAGGDGNVVRVRSDGILTTYGDNAAGILAESLGGGGGDGGFSITGAGGGWGGFSIGVGGFGDGGGFGSTVVVANYGSIWTAGEKSYGIRARSIGGGGGDGGFSISGAGGGDYGGTFNVGGFGDVGGDAGEVIVRNLGNVLTLGTKAVGIMAESIGGGGGDGGFSITGSGAGTGALSVGIGGGGDGGGDGAAVTVTNDGLITTEGEKAHGIRGRSIGGGGGDGGFSITGSGAGDYSGTFSIGGSGALGGDGAAVSIYNNGTITVSGKEADGILAASVGGGGGDGGWSVNGSGAGDGAFNVGIGGFGGDGGSAGIVRVENADSITSYSEMGRGIVASSLGGGGGDGGFSFVGSFSGDAGKDLSISVGGFGGDGGAGGEVHVINSGTIDMSELGEHGIVATSTGGGGGDGGAAYSVGTGFGGAKNTWNVNVSAAVGGFGGDGNVGGDVYVTNNGSVITRNHDAHAIVAMSTGGGGGNGGSSFAATVGLGSGGEGRTFNSSISVGGWGGEGNVGGDVTVINTGDLITFGDKADAVHAQSIGGGGGNGGKSTGLSLLLSAGGPAADAEKDQIAGNNWNTQVNVGGFGGSGNDSGEVTVTNEGDIWTHGALSRGIVAQSVGAGGGSGGEAFKGTDTAADFVALANNLGGTGKMNKLLQQLRDWSFTVGGDGGASGNADNVIINNSGSILTEGFASTAIFAQSIGGGGGESQNFVQATAEGGTATAGATGKVGVGGAGGAAGDGGDIEINQDGAIHTLGNEAYGIYAQSIGGGGGKAGNVDRALADGNDFVPVIKNIGIGLSFGRDGGGAGDGGTVTINSIGTIVTEGADAAGIHAQSVGGGGGETGGLPNEDIPLLSMLSFKGSVGGAGSGGDVNVSHTGDILTTGAGSDGIFAQSAGGLGDGGIVTVNLQGSIVAEGEDASGIVAQSIGENSSGDIFVTIEGGSVIGGTGSGAGVLMADGSTNSLVNHGLVGSMPGVWGTAIVSTGGDDRIENFGTVIGSVDLGSGLNSFENYGWMHTGTTLFIGDGNLLTNAGGMSPGGVDNLMTTQLVGNYLGTSESTLLFDVQFDHGNEAHDGLAITGTAVLNGTLALNLIDTQHIMPGSFERVLITSSGGITDDGIELSVADSAVVSYDLFAASDSEHALRYAVDFSPDGMDNSYMAIGDYINRIQLAGGSEGTDPVAARLVALPDDEMLKAAYDRLSPHIYLANQASRVFAGLGFDQTLHSCPVREGDYRFAAEGQCTWMNVMDRDVAYDGASGTLGSSEQATSVNLGVQKALTEHWYGGLAFGYETSDLTIPQFAERDGNQYQFGGIFKGRYGPHKFSFSASYGTGSYDTRRHVLLPEDDVIVDGDRGIDTVAAHVQYSFEFGGEAWYLLPLVDLGYTNVDSEGLTESGAEGVGLIVDAVDYNFVTGRVALKLGGEWVVGNDTLIRPFLEAGVTRFLDDDSPEISAGFAGAPAGVEPFTQWQEFDENFTDAAAGFDVLWTNNIAARFGFAGQYGNTWDSESWYLKLLYGFE